MGPVVREKDVCWEYAEKLDGNKVRCKFCQRVLNGGISRLKHHLSRFPSKGVNPCSKVRDDVTDRVRGIIASKEEVKETSSVKKQKLAEVKSPSNLSATKALVSLDAPSPLMKIFPTGNPITPSSTNNQENAERSIALFFFENKLDFSVARSSSYQLMIDAIAKCPGFTGPSAEILKITWLERIKSEVGLQSKDVEKEWATTGCTIIADTWTDYKSKAIINFLVSSPSRTFFHKSVDASPYFKNTKWLADLFDSVIQEFGVENVVQIIMDSSVNYTGIANHIVQSYGTIFVSPCASQCLNLILEEFSKVDWITRCILQAQTISKLIYNNATLLDLMKKYSGGQELIKTGITKSVSTFLSLQSMLRLRTRLKNMFHSHEYASNTSYANKPHSLSCIAIAEDEDFFNVLEKLLPVPDMRRDITNQIYTFTKAHGMFGCSLAKEARHTVAPWLWWEQYGDSAPGLQRVAIRILSQVCSTYSFHRQWSNFRQIHSEKRNKIDRETLNDLVYINYNLKLGRQMNAKSSEVDLLQLDDIDMTSEWVEENETATPTQWLDRFGPALDGNDLNTRQFSSSIFGANDPIFGL
ncbi:hypothetical protein ACSQ67_019175 [Phaseolus vulgaris]